MRRDGPAPSNGSRARDPLRAVPWRTSGAAVLLAGLLAAMAALLRWWSPCFPASVRSAACTARRSDELGLSGFTVLPADLRLAAVLLAVGGIVSAAMWFVPLFAGPTPTWRLATQTVLVLGCSAKAIVDLWWYLGGGQLTGHAVHVVSDLCWLALALITYTPALQFTAAESLAARRPGGGRLTLLLIAIVVAGPLGVFADFLTWRAAYNSPGYAPGEGLLRAAALVLIGVAVLVASAWRSRRPRPAPDTPEFTLAA